MYTCIMLDRNSELYTEICQVHLKSVSGKPFSQIQDFIKVYGTPSTIKFSSSNKYRSGGIEYSYKITMSYPGLKESDFGMFHKLVHNRFVAKVFFVNKQLYVIGSKKIPLEMTTRFKNGAATDISLQGKSISPLRLSYNDIASETDGFPYIITKDF